MVPECRGVADGYIDDRLEYHQRRSNKQTKLAAKMQQPPRRYRMSKCRYSGPKQSSKSLWKSSLRHLVVEEETHPDKQHGYGDEDEERQDHSLDPRKTSTSPNEKETPKADKGIVVIQPKQHNNKSITIDSSKSQPTNMILPPRPPPDSRSKSINFNGSQSQHGNRLFFQTLKHLPSAKFQKRRGQEEEKEATVADFHDRTEKKDDDDNKALELLPSPPVSNTVWADNDLTIEAREHSSGALTGVSSLGEGSGWRNDEENKDGNRGGNEKDNDDASYSREGSDDDNNYDDYDDDYSSNFSLDEDDGLSYITGYYTYDGVDSRTIGDGSATSGPFSLGKFGRSLFSTGSALMDLVPHSSEIFERVEKKDDSSSTTELAAAEEESFENDHCSDRAVQQSNATTPTGESLCGVSHTKKGPTKLVFRRRKGHGIHTNISEEMRGKERVDTRSESFVDSAIEPSQAAAALAPSSSPIKDDCSILDQGFEIVAEKLNRSRSTQHNEAATDEQEKISPQQSPTLFTEPPLLANRAERERKTVPRVPSVKSEFYSDLPVVDQGFEIVAQHVGLSASPRRQIPDCIQKTSSMNPSTTSSQHPERPSMIPDITSIHVSVHDEDDVCTNASAHSLDQCFLAAKNSSHETKPTTTTTVSPTTTTSINPVMQLLFRTGRPKRFGKRSDMERTVKDRIDAIEKNMQSSGCPSTHTSKLGTIGNKWFHLKKETKLGSVSKSTPLLLAKDDDISSNLQDSSSSLRRVQAVEPSLMGDPSVNQVSRHSSNNINNNQNTLGIFPVSSSLTQRFTDDQSTTQGSKYSPLYTLSSAQDSLSLTQMNDIEPSFTTDDQSTSHVSSDRPNNNKSTAPEDTSPRTFGVEENEVIDDDDDNNENDEEEKVIACPRKGVYKKSSNCPSNMRVAARTERHDTRTQKMKVEKKKGQYKLENESKWIWRNPIFTTTMFEAVVPMACSIPHIMDNAPKNEDLLLSSSLSEDDSFQETVDEFPGFGCTSSPWLAATTACAITAWPTVEACTTTTKAPRTILSSRVVDTTLSSLERVTSLEVVGPMRRKISMTKFCKDTLSPITICWWTMIDTLGLDSFWNQPHPRKTSRVVLEEDVVEPSAQIEMVLNDGGPPGDKKDMKRKKIKKNTKRNKKKSNKLRRGTRRNRFEIPPSSSKCQRPTSPHQRLASQTRNQQDHKSSFVEAMCDEQCKTEHNQPNRWRSIKSYPRIAKMMERQQHQQQSQQLDSPVQYSADQQRIKMDGRADDNTKYDERRLMMFQISNDSMIPRAPSTASF